jgi:hypothetical protein
MTAPQLQACYFPGAADADIRQWSSLARVLTHTAAQHCPTWTRTILAISPPKVTSAINRRSHISNSQKLEHWCDLIAAAPLGERILLIDADTAILRPLDDIWERDFDLAYTERDRSVTRFPINGGVLFVRVSESAKAFVEAWRLENRRMLTLKDWRATYGVFGGINQAAFMVTLKRRKDFGTAALALPCREWNCEDSSWRKFDKATTRILHVKSELKRNAFSRYAPIRGDLQPLVTIWRQLDTQAAAAAPA